MIQLYFLSIVCNCLAGYVLFAGSDNNENTPFPVNNPTFILALGILSAVSGVLKLLSSMDIPVIGDLLPAASGIIAGIILIFGIYRQNISSKPGELDRLGVSLLAFRKPIGLILLAVAVLHFLFPRALFL
ncbi:MAG: hypothetical protein FWD24_04970 [Treponema sp.]|nr:hypothetical protein [Treponema sp.]